MKKKSQTIVLTTNAMTLKESWWALPKKTSFNYSTPKFILPAVLRITRGKQRPNGWAARRRCLLRLFPIGQFLWLSHVNSPGIRWKFPGSSVPCVLDAPDLKRSEISGILQIWAQQTTQRQFCETYSVTPMTFFAFVVGEARAMLWWY